jgi:hypothetical protein
LVAIRNPTGAPYGAYGLRIEGAAPARAMLQPVDAGLPLLRVRWARDPSPPPEAEHSPDGMSTAEFTRRGAVIDLGAAGAIDVRRASRTATFRMRAPRDPHALVHPYLGGAVAIVSRWLGREAIHGGAFVHGSAAWVVLGSRTAGKSSLLGWLHREGHAILADDVVVVERGCAFAAPRSLDLREDSAARLGVGESLGRVGARERWRVRLGPAPGLLPLAGFVSLAWGERVEVGRVTGAQRLEQLSAGLAMPQLPADAAAVLDLAALPALELRRPKDWGALDAAGHALLAAVAGEPERL